MAIIVSFYRFEVVYKTLIHLPLHNGAFKAGTAPNGGKTFAARRSINRGEHEHTATGRQ